MSHLLDSMYSVREMPWHGLGTVLEDYPETWADARQQAGLDWEPVPEPVYRRLMDGNFVELPDQRRITRTDRTGVTLAVVSKSMSESLYPNAQLGPLIEAFQDGGLLYETAGSLDEGRKVWVLVRAKEPFEIPGDPNGATLPFLSVQNNHDGQGSLRVQRLQTRIVCANTSAAADREAKRHGLEYVFKHTASIKDRVELAKKAINGLSADRVAYAEWAADLMALRVTTSQRERFIEHYFPMPVAEHMISDRVVGNIETARDTLRGILNGQTCEGIGFNAYGLVQAAVEYQDHYRTARSPETRFSRSMLYGNSAKTVAEKLAREAAMC